MLLCGAAAFAHHLGESSAFERVLAAADKAHDRGKEVEAERGYAEAEALAKRPQNQVYARFQRALALRRLARPEEARAVLRALAKRWPKDDKTPRALYVAARILEVDLKDKVGAEEEHVRLLRRSPRSDSATRSLARVADLRADRSLDVALDFLRETYRANKRNALGPRALYLGATFFEERAKLPDDAVRLYELLARRYPKSALCDDALWRAAHLHRTARRFDRALVLLRQLARTRRESWAFGSYNSAHLDKAALLIAEIHLGDRRDLDAGIDALRTFISDFPHSFLRWRARGLLVLNLVRAGRKGDARSALADLEKHHPKTRWARLAREAVQTGVVPSTK